MPDNHVRGSYVTLLGEPFYCIHNFDQMPPFFMSLVSSADHWLFVAGTGGLTAGRINAESALFPYYTEDKISENCANTGPVTYLHVRRAGESTMWQPFAARPAGGAAGGGEGEILRNLYKNIPGDTLVFEEVHKGLGLTYRYAWRTSPQFGIVRTSFLENNRDEPCTVRLLDGVQNLLPYGATTALQTTMSNLLDAYKRCELDPATGLGIFSLSATLTDRAEPSESLKATVAWHIGLDGAEILLSGAQIDAFRQGRAVVQEEDVKGRRGAYLLCAAVDLAGGAQEAWSLVADVNQDHCQVAALRNLLMGDRAHLGELLARDIACGTAELRSLVASADGLQQTADVLTTAHHFANVTFNIMRGGVFAGSGRIEKADLLDFAGARNRSLLAPTHPCAAFWAELPASLPASDLYRRAAATGAPDIIRLCYEYLPLTFSRRHGDPSRPWNQFSINLRHADGRRRLDFQGNWRDIFQNWEPLAWSFPMFLPGMIARFLNATTADGYNPYRVTREGIEWETPAPDHPWANIGYWSDHQIIYLLKLLELAVDFAPELLPELLHQPLFSYADVPYRIRPYADLLADPQHTIVFDRQREAAVAGRVRELGGDGKLVAVGGAVYHVTLLEKLLVLLLAKLVNLVPEGGIWMNTQRPEWNDANNALVGKGLSVVTAAYLRRYIVFCRSLFARSSAAVRLSSEVTELLAAVSAALEEHQGSLVRGFDDGARRRLMDRLGHAGGKYRAAFYREGFSGDCADVAGEDVAGLLDLALAYVEQTLRANRRADGLYHAYNLLRLTPRGAAIDPLYEMLEGQVAILSSGLLGGEEALALLRSLRSSALYRADQHSYILYPDRELPGFLQKNQVPPHKAVGLQLVDALVARGDRTLLLRDEDGVYHFNGAFRNAGDVAEALAQLAADPQLAPLVTAETPAILALFEATFAHHAFTGRSGTFFAYEGLGSIYWHMVAKLLLAAQENFWWARAAGADPAVQEGLAAAYYDIRGGIGFNKPPGVYGAFPTDPYSHTPKGQGARQPGMTGQVKEEILTRFGELGLRVQAGAVHFDPALLRRDELIGTPACFDYIGVAGRRQVLDLPAHALAFTFCQTPVVLLQGEQEGIEVRYADGHREAAPGHTLPQSAGAELLARSGVIESIVVTVGSLDGDPAY
jgi:hypothetical protein